MVCVWFEGDVSSASTCSFTGEIESDRLGVFDRFEEVVAFANDLAGRAHDDAADERTGADLSHALRRELECASHHAAIGVGPGVSWFSYRSRQHCDAFKEEFRTQRRKGAKEDLRQPQV